jgi:hypothetical protein
LILDLKQTALVLARITQLHSHGQLTIKGSVSGKGHIDMPVVMSLLFSMVLGVLDVTATSDVERKGTTVRFFCKSIETITQPTALV